jgi:hypothetical protein
MLSIHASCLSLCCHLGFAIRAWPRSAELSCLTTLSTDVVRRDLCSGITALSKVCDESGRVFGPEFRLKHGENGEQEISMHNLVEAILEQELFFGSVYY